MTQNLENALHRLQDARTAIFLETGNQLNTMEQEEAMSIMINKIESLINAYER